MTQSWQVVFTGENHLFCIANHQWDATQNNFLRLTLRPVAFSTRELAEVFYSGAEVL
jgi:hypothetical protein